MSVQLLLASSSPRRKSILNLAQIDFVTYSPQLDEATLTKRLLAIYNDVCQSALGRIVTSELAFHKALTAARMTSAPLILASDTIVMCRGYILGKPNNAEIARIMFKLLLGETLNADEANIMQEAHACNEEECCSKFGQLHQVSTSVCLLISKDLLNKFNLSKQTIERIEALPDTYVEKDNYVRILFVEQAGVYMQANSPLFTRIIEDYIASGACFDKAGGYAVQEQTACLINKIDGDVYTIMGLPIHAILQKCGELMPFKQTEAQFNSQRTQTRISEIKPIVQPKAATVETNETPEQDNYRPIPVRTRSSVARFNSTLLQNLTSYNATQNEKQADKAHDKANETEGYQQAGPSLKSVEQTDFNKQSAKLAEPDLSLSKPINTNEQELVGALKSKLSSLKSSSSFSQRDLPQFLKHNK